MHAIPGFMFADPLLPPVQVLPLVQVGGTPKGSPASDVEPESVPASAPPPAAPPAPVPQPTVVYPPAIHACIAADSAAVARVPGAGGIGVVLSCILASARCAFVCDGSLVEGAVSDPYVASEGRPG